MRKRSDCACRRRSILKCSSGPLGPIRASLAYDAGMTIGVPFLLGVNYWPRRKAMYWWADFDAGEVREEFAMIRDLGLTHVRFFLLWESFQPTPTTVSASALRDLRTVC